MTRHFYIAILFFIALASTPGFAQDHLSGRVLDQQTNEPLVGANIRLSGTATGVSTDVEGHFTLELNPGADSLLITYIGYQKKKIKIPSDAQSLNILLEPDNVALNELQVVGFDSRKTLQRTSGSVSLITEKSFNRTSQISLQPILNTIPGVRMDQSNLSDARISIRGSGVRSNFGIRNIKIYVNEIPITEADGFTRIEGLDVATLGRAEVIKGPASSVYGMGTGGVINFQTQRASYGFSSIEFSNTVGSFGMRRNAMTYRTGTDKFNASITYGDRNHNGFRAHNDDDRNFFTGSFQFYPNEKQTVSVLLSRSKQRTQLPGDLTAAQVDENPRQAARGNVVQDARRDQDWTRLGLANNYKFTDKFKNITSAFASFYNMDHPLPFAVIRQPYNSYGGRTRFVFSPDMKRLPTTFMAGAEFLNGVTDSKRFVNNQGVEGDLIFNQERDITQLSIFYQSETELSSKTTLTFGLSFNDIEYDIQDFLNRDFNGVKNFDSELMPRVGVNHLFNDKIALRASFSRGFSPPTTSELDDAQGRINNNLQAEKANNYEIGARGSVLKGSLQYDVVFFSMQMDDQLIPRDVGPDNTIFVNAGETSKNGVELALNYALERPGKFISSFRPFISYTFSDFDFKEFIIEGNNGEIISDFSDKEVTGIAPHNVSAGIDLQTSFGAYSYTTLFFNDRFPINDANTIYNPSYTVLNSKVGIERQLFNSFSIDAHVGINNISDSNYSSNVALNAVAFGGGEPAFFNPAPDRHFFTGLSLTYNL